MYKIVHGRAEDKLLDIADSSIDLIFTSPPYAEQRKKTYGGISEDKYVEWFKEIAIQIKRILKPTGSFFLNIKPHVKNGERSLYVFDLVIMLKRELGFNYVDEYCWVKNAFPTGTLGRFKNAFEPIYHFSVGNINNITFNPLACGKPVSKETLARTYRKNTKTPKNGSGMIVDKDNLKTLEIARPSNVIVVNNVTNQHTYKIKHSAVFPDKLVEFFVKSFSNENDIVLDMFAGSGTTGNVCKKLNRNVILIKKELEYIKLMENNIGFF